MARTDHGARSHLVLHNLSYRNRIGNLRKHIVAIQWLSTSVYVIPKLVDIGMDVA
jgi:hypothetical protein